jgi:uncharacterized protein YcfL
MGYMNKSINGRMQRQLCYKTTLLTTGISRHVLQVSYTEFQQDLRNDLQNKRKTPFIIQSIMMDQYS